MTIRHYCPSILVEVPRSVYWNFSTPTHLDRKLNSDRRSRYFESLKRDSSPEKFHFFRPFCWVRIDVRNLDIPFKLSLWPAERAFVPAYFLERVRPFNRKGTITQLIALLIAIRNKRFHRIFFDWILTIEVLLIRQ